MPVEGGEPRPLTKANGAADTHPVFSRDGRTLYVLAQRRAGFESDRWYLDAYDVATGTKRTLFTTPDLSVDEFALSQDAETIWFTAGEEARTNLFTVPAAAARRTAWSRADRSRVIQPGRERAWSSRCPRWSSPAEIYRASAGRRDRAAADTRERSVAEDSRRSRNPRA